MANEDFLPQAFAEFYLKANPDQPSDNQQLNKIEVPNDQVAIGVTPNTYVGGTNLSQNLSDNMTIGASVSSSTADPSTFTWGGYGVTPASFTNSTASTYQNKTPNDMVNTFFTAGWYWGYGGVWK